MPSKIPANPAEIEAQLGPRGNTTINGENRPLARRWIAAKGWGAAFAAILSYKELNIAYNRAGAGEYPTDPWLSKRKAQWEIKQAAAKESGEGNGDAGDTFSFDEKRDDSWQNGDFDDRATFKTAVERINAEPNVTSDAAKLAEVLQGIIAKGGGSVDAAQVEALVDKKWAELPDLIARYSPVTTIEIKRHDGSEHKIEGHAHAMLKDLILAASSRQPNGFHPNIMLAGPTGSGKTHACAQAAAALGLEFYSNGAVSMDHQLIGFRDAHGTYHTTPLREAFAKPAWYLFDEMDASDNSPLLAVAAVTANGHYDFPDGKIERHVDSVISAAGNTWGLGATSDFVGRAKLDGAIRSRFPVRLMWGYDERLERALTGNIDWAVRVQKARAAASKAGLKVIIDPRMTYAGAALIAAGMTETRAAELTYLADLTEDQRRIVEA